MSNRYAIVDAQGVVQNVIEWDGDSGVWAPEDGYTAVVIPEGAAVGPGWSYVDEAFTAPPEPMIPVPPKTQFTVREFTRRFTMGEQVAIRQATLVDMQVGLVYDDFNRAEFIDVNDPAVAAGIDFYISKSLLASGRKSELLAPEVVTAS